MHTDPSFRRLHGRHIHLQPTGFFGKLFAIIAAGGLLVLGLMFSVVIVAVAAVGGVLFWGWMWWRTRDLRRRMRDQMDNPMHTPFGDVPASGGRVIEGEVIRSDRDSADR
ncbi:hypothetical protein [Methyloversatilis sp.]|uniref:hypothetical protein n=1 Tax=Methyloversatilis sp. TaxID=2569862 RepID=UPI0035B24FF1